MGKLDGKVALVTGSGRGLGKAIALCFAKEGADVVVNDISNMESTASKVVALGRKAIAVQADVSKKNDVDRMLKFAFDTFQKIDILVNNAAVTRHAPLLSMTEADWDMVLNVDLKGVFNCIQATSIYMVKQRSGKIINIASVAGVGHAHNVGKANYAAAKGGVIQLTKVAALELGSYGISVNAVAPGKINTDMAYSGRNIDEGKKQIEEFKNYAILGRIGEPEEIASLVLFLASDEANFITGQVIRIDGGRIDMM